MSPRTDTPASDASLSPSAGKRLRPRSRPWRLLGCNSLPASTGTDSPRLRAEGVECIEQPLRIDGVNERRPAAPCARSCSRWRWPMRCQLAAGIAAAFFHNSCGRLSPRSATPTRPRCAATSGGNGFRNRDERDAARAVARRAAAARTRPMRSPANGSRCRSRQHDVVRHRLIDQPGGQCMSRPPSRWTCRCGTVCPPCSLQFTTSR